MQSIQDPHMPSFAMYLSPTMTTTNYNINAAISEKPLVGFHRKDSGELDVFEAARYFSGDVDGVGFGIERFADGHAIQKRNSFEIPTQQADLQLQHPQKKTEMQLRNKKCKPSSSPAAKLASYLNSFLLQRTSKKKSKCMSNPQSISSNGSFKSLINIEEPNCEVCEDKKTTGVTWRSRRTKSIDLVSENKSKCMSKPQSISSNDSFKSVINSHSTESIIEELNCEVYEDKKISDVTWRSRRTKSIDLVSENKNNYYKDSGSTDWLSENKWLMMINNGSNGEKWRFQRDVGKEEVDDVESDSSSDLFELKNIGSIDDALSELLPAYGTADMKVLGNGSAAFAC